MSNIYTWAAKPAKRTLTVGDLKAAKGKRKFTQVTANNIEEAEAAEKVGFDMIISNAKNVIPVREGSKNLFLTAALVAAKSSLKELSILTSDVLSPFAIFALLEETFSTLTST